MIGLGLGLSLRVVFFSLDEKDSDPFPFCVRVN